MVKYLKYVLQIISKFKSFEKMFYLIETQFVPLVVWLHHTGICDACWARM